MKPQPADEQSSSLAPACITQTGCFIPSEIFSSEKTSQGTAKTRALRSDRNSTIWQNCDRVVLVVVFEFYLLTMSEGQTSVIAVIASLP